MANVPVVRQVAWISLIPQVLIYLLIGYIYYLLFPGIDPFFVTTLTYVIVIIVVRNAVAKKHRKGIKLFKQSKFEEAIPLFEDSVAYFTKNTWVDKYRYITLLSSSKMSYREMGLCNIAFCYSQINQGEKAKAYYNLVLREYPENGLAIAALRMLNASS